MHIRDFVTAAAQQLGANPRHVESATGGLLACIRSEVDAQEFSQLTAVMPGALDVLRSAPSMVLDESVEVESSGGMLGGLGNLATSMMGGDAPPGVLQSLLGSGLGAGSLAAFIPIFFDFAKRTAGNELIGKVLRRLPEIQALAG